MSKLEIWKEIIKIDLHIHTFASLKDAKFNFSMDKLIEYVSENELNVIGITNHDLFDKNQFIDIQNEINKVRKDCLVLMGVEITLDNSHMLLFSNENINEFDKKVKNFSSKIIENKGLSYDDFIKEFKNLSDYLLIPHYFKKPKISNELLLKLKDYIKLGEVTSPKKFNRLKKDGNLIPVIFSDLRIEDKKELMGKFTFLNTNFENINGFIKFKNFIENKNNKTFHSPFFDERKYLLNKSKVIISENKNLLIGKRDSGKTYILNEIENLFSGEERVKYIRQFEISKQAESLDNESEKKSFINKRKNFYKEEFSNEKLIPLKNLTKKIMTQHSFLLKKEQLIEEFLEELKDYSKRESWDAYSQLKIFKSKNLINVDVIQMQKETEKIYKALNIIKESFENEIYEKIFSKFIVKENLSNVINEFQILYKKKLYEFNVIRVVNEIVKKVKDNLEEYSSVKIPKEFDILKYSSFFYLEKKLNNFIKNLKESVINEKTFYGKFIVKMFVSKFENKNDIQKYHGDNIKRKDIWKFYEENDYFHFILNHINVPTTDHSKLFQHLIKLNVEIKKKNNEDLSGGEKAELYLLTEIENALDNEIILIDEPESSFDNVFLNDEVARMINAVKGKTIIMITHNHVLADSYNSDQIIISKKENNERLRYFNSAGSEKLTSFDGGEIDLYNDYLEILEAGEEKYINRGKRYDSIKNK